MTKHIPVIEFEYYRVSNVDFKMYDNEESIEELDIEEGIIKATIGMDPESTKGLVRLETTVIDKQLLRIATVEVTGYFSITNPKDEQNHSYLKSNGTAILMPYLRSTISILTSIDNDKAIILPTTNTNNFTEAEKG